MAALYRETEYAYSSARVRALENRLVGREHIEHFLTAKSSEDIIAQLTELGFKTEGATSREEILLSAVKASFAEIEELAPDKSIFRFLQYQYDCNNIKSVLKCQARGVSSDEMLFDFGSVEAETVKKAVETKDYSAFPENMAKAAEEAEATFAKTGDPQIVDVMLDRACFADMLAAAGESGVEFIVGLVRKRVDLLNILSTLRVMRMRGSEFMGEFLSKALLDGGEIDHKVFLDSLEGGEGALFDELRYSKFDRVIEALEKTDKSLSEYERELENIWITMVKKAKYVPFGAEVLVAYLIAVEYGVKNIRIILAGKDAGLDAEVIRERLRESYV